MKTITLIFVAILILGVPTVFAEDERKDIPIEEAMNAYCGTWVNKDYSEKARYSVVVIINPDGTFVSYGMEDYDPNFPQWKGTFTITEAWTDSEGDVWIKVMVKIVLPKFPYDWYHLSKISNSGRTYEYVGHSEDYLTEIDQNHPKYRIYYRR